MNPQYSVCGSHSNCSGSSNYTAGEGDIDCGEHNNERRKKGVRFENVKIYLFERTQGFDVVPSSGGFALGMQKKHFDVREIALCSNRVDDDKTKLRDNKLPARNLAEQVCFTKSSNKGKRKYYGAFDENSAVIKRQKIDDRSVNQALSKMRTTTNIDSEDSGTSEKTFSKCVRQGTAGHLGSIEKKSGEDNICIRKKYLRPLSRRTRIFKLRSAGFKKFLKDDQMICDVIRESRKHCGCSCDAVPCSLETCECCRDGIECLVDQPSFPCTCTAAGCNNPFGRREFDGAVVHAHFLSTLMRTQASRNQKLNDSFSVMHLRFDDE